MAIFDLPLDTLRTYRPSRDEPDDFDEFWGSTLQEQSSELNLTLDTLSSPLKAVDVIDASFGGFGGERIHAWIVQPREDIATGNCVVIYPGYGHGRGYPHQWLSYANAGHSVFVMDNRGQGGGTEHPGATSDPVGGANPEIPGFLTRGIVNRQSYYLRRLYTDAYRAVDAARAITGSRTVVLAGGSLGGGTALAVSGLRTDIVLTLADAPSLALFRRATEISNVGARHEIAQYLATHRDQVDTVFSTLAYFDVVNFVPRAEAHANFSAGLMDQICPPSTVFAAYNYYSGPKSIDIWPYNGHEGGGQTQHLRNLHLIDEITQQDRKAVN